MSKRSGWTRYPSPRSRDPIPRSTRAVVLLRDAARCRIRSAVCITSATEVDHVDRTYRGADRHAPERCQAACTPCHRAKSQAEAQDALTRARRRPPQRHPSDPR